MKRVLPSLGLALALVVGAHSGFANDFEKEIKARQSLMEVYAFNIGILGAMAKGEMPYDSEVAQAAADNLNAAVSMKNPTMWPQGSDRATLGEATRAKADIWSTYPKVAEKSQEMQDAAAQMASVAGTDLDSVRANMKQLADGCKGCHEPFRVPED